MSHTPKNRIIVLRCAKHHAPVFLHDEAREDLVKLMRSEGFLAICSKLPHKLKVKIV